MKETVRVGLDVGSTTVKIAILDNNNNLIYGDYQRHRADVRATVERVLKTAFKECAFDPLQKITVAVTGSGGLNISEWLDVPFIQEVVAATMAIKRLIPKTSVAIELGGEDAKITYLSGQLEQRMNGTCAGGTGSFIDQMAALLETDAAGLNELARGYKTIYPIAARCGVFAKTDVQPLINEGAAREDIAASIFNAVVTQTIAGLACGKKITGAVAFLGGPLHFLDQLRDRFIKVLKLTPENTIVPEKGELFVAMGSALGSTNVAGERLADCEGVCSPCGTDEEKEEKGVHSSDKSFSGLTVGEILSRLENIGDKSVFEVARLDALFKDDKALSDFRARHKKATAPKADIKKATGDLFLGLDGGSTTTKAVLIDSEGAILWSDYRSNRGNPVLTAVDILKDLYKKLPPSAHIAGSCSTGYGEELFKAAFGCEIGEVETIAHFRAARQFVPKVEFLLDIGGQDMKCIRAHDGAITGLQLNEACSSGCGSFLENFASTMSLTAQKFGELALTSQNPVDLGSRCTVFMNSRVKQAQKEGAAVADIAAGLCYSVIKNALFKVIKLRSSRDIGEHVVVQGGTFYNDAVLRAFELLSGVEAVRPDVAGLMGALGAALLAKDNKDSKNNTNDKESSGSKNDTNNDKNKSARHFITNEELQDFSVEMTTERCGGCLNNCMLTINRFGSNFEKGEKRSVFVSGNRCERGLERATREGSGDKSLDANSRKTTSFVQAKKLPNMFDWKYKRLFSYYKPNEAAPMGSVGIPRVLNMFENYPLWFTLWTELGFNVVLSGESSKRVYEKGMETLPSESVCYPGKISHGHMIGLLEKLRAQKKFARTKDGDKVFIFFPCAPYEKQEDLGAGNHYNCPIVTSYPEVLRNNIDDLRQDKSVLYIDPFLPIYDKKRLFERLSEELVAYFEIDKKVLKSAVDKAWEAQETFRRDVESAGEMAVEEMIREGGAGVILAGRPYHLDPEINHGIPSLINDLGLAVFTEDSVAQFGSVERPLRIIDQWVYHNRLYRAANFSSLMKDTELIQLTSFGCGLDAVTADQVDEIMRSKGRMYTLIKIDEGSNLGAVRIRIRSLIAAVKERQRSGEHPKERSAAYRRQVFTKEMKASYTIIGPQMSPIHFRLLQEALRACGYNFVVLDAVDTKAVDAGLKYVNNDACYPSILVAGQMIAALESGRFDVNKTALIITQTGGGCRATNYIGFIRRALVDAGFPQVPVLSLSAQAFEKNPGFKVNAVLLHRMVMALVAGDLLMRVLLRTRPYEKVPGSANALYEKWNKEMEVQLHSLSIAGFNRVLKGAVKDFDSLPLRPQKKARVGVVGEILVKFHPTANNEIIKTIEAEGAEAVLPDLTDFFFYTFSTGIFRHEKLAFPSSTEANAKLLVWFLELYRRKMKKYLRTSKRFTPPSSIYDLMDKVDDIVQLGNITGEGWFLTAEMVELITSGVPTVACVQPFACLPNHVTGKGMIKELRRRFPEANIAAIDYDPGASEVNQLNRLKLLLANAPAGMHPDEDIDGLVTTEDGEKVKPDTLLPRGSMLIFNDAAAKESSDPGTRTL